jgi:hypothetical protein
MRKLSASSKENLAVGDQIEHVGDSDYRLTFKVASWLFFQFSEMKGQHHGQRMVHGRGRCGTSRKDSI